MKPLFASLLSAVVGTGCVFGPVPPVVMAERSVAGPGATTPTPQGGQQQTELLEPSHPDRRGAYPSYAGILTATLGYREFEADQLWRALQNPFQGGLEYAYRPMQSFLAFAVGGIGAYDREITTAGGISRSIDAFTLELYAGPKIYLEPKRLPLQFHVGVGASFLYAELERPIGSNRSLGTDGTLGVYGQVGAAYRLDKRNSIGAEYRFLSATDLTLSGINGNANYSQFSLTFSHAF